MKPRDSHPSITRSPCEGFSKAMLCRTQLLACRRFVTFQHRGDIDTRLHQRPTRELFQQLFHE